MSEYRLAWRLAWRELRGGLAGFRVFLATLALGVGVITAVASVSAAVTQGLKADARLLLGGDIEVRLVQRVPSAAEAQYLAANAQALSAAIEMRAMARDAASSGPAAMVELKAVDAAYPLLGRIELAEAADLPALLAFRDGRWGAVVEPALLAKPGVAIGAEIIVGEARLEVRGTIAREPDRVASVAVFGPRLMIAADALPATGLVQPGSLLRHNTRVLLPVGEPAKEWAAAARAAFPEAGWQIRDPAEAAPGVERFVERLAMFLNFAGLTALLIGGLGVANAVRTYLDGKIGTIATLKCLGAPGRLVMASYLLQVLVLAALGTAIGLALGATAPLLLLDALQDLMPVRVAPGLHPGALATAAALGLLTTLTFALWPLGCAREVAAAALFRQGVTGLSGRPRFSVRLATALAALALAALTIATAADPGFGALFVAGAAVTLLILKGAAIALTAGARRLPRAGGVVVRLAIDALRLPGAPTATVLTSLGAGLTVLVAVAAIDSNLQSEIGERLPVSVPAFFFIDIQGEQAEDFDATVTAVPGVGPLRRVPALRGRIVRLNRTPVEEAPIAPEARWAVQGDRALTFASAPPEDARITAGAWWPAGYEGPPLLSLDAGLATGFGLGVGDTLTVNVLGRNIEARIASLRQIEWRAVPFDFALIFTPATFAGAPLTHIAAVHAPPAAETALAAAVSARFSNITAIRTREAIEAVSGLMARVAFGVRSVAAITLVAGALVLAGAIAADRQRRTYEAVLFKVLGATRRTITLIYAVEYGLLGLITAMIATALGTAIAWAVTTHLLRVVWSFDGTLVAGTLGASTAITLVLGFATTWRRLGQKTAAVLRNA